MVITMETDNKESKQEETFFNHEHSLLSSLFDYPSGIEPLVVAKLFFYLCTEKNSKEAWIRLISYRHLQNGESAEYVDFWWKFIKLRKTFEYTKTVKDEEQRKVYIFRVVSEINRINNLFPVSVIRENGTWKIEYFGF